jgi:hypothetical protein
VEGELAQGRTSWPLYGKIDLVMPVEGEALFDGRGAGSAVYRPGSAREPTVGNGGAFVLYLLPEGKIRFT